MNGQSRKRRVNMGQAGEGAHLASRLIRCLPAASFEMETLCRLAGIKASYDIPTAAVECRQRPNMLLNPDFVAQYCKSDEHLFLLVMHELWHIILAHTRLYPRVTMIHNIAFDAIINAGLSRQFSAPEYRGFFEAINPADQFPGMLLRPPVGWPENPQYPPAESLPPGGLEILQRLYPPHNRTYDADPLYEEILELLRQAGLGQEYVVILLGDHDSSEREGQALDNALFREMLKGMVGKWPKFPIAVNREAGSSEGLSDWFSDRQPSSEQARRAFAQTLRRCLGTRSGRERRKARADTPGTTGMGVLPNARDRLNPARRQLGAPGMLWNQTGQVRARVPEKPSKAHVYLDVSGSMAELLPHLLSILLPYVSQNQADVFQFSNYVEPMPLEDLKKGKLRSSGGTDINCVLRHALEAHPAIHRALIVTDGYTGFPHPQLAGQIHDQNIRIYTVLPAELAVKTQMAGISTQIIVLPPWSKSGSRWRIGQ